MPKFQVIGRDSGKHIVIVEGGRQILLSDEELDAAVSEVAAEAAPVVDPAPVVEPVADPVDPAAVVEPTPAEPEPEPAPAETGKKKNADG